MKRALGQQETQMLAYLQMRKQRTVRTGDLLHRLRLSADQERELFQRMASGGLIARVRRGLYLVPPHLPLGGSWSPDETLALNALMEDRGGRYQISGPNAFNRYGFDGQVPTRIYAYNNRISGEREIGSVALTLIKVADDRLGDTEEVRTIDGQTAVYSSRVRTLVDGVYDWSRFNGLPRAFHWIRTELALERVDPAKLVAATVRFGDVGTIRRMGVLLEREGIDERLLKKLERAIGKSTSFIPWIPTRTKRGSVNRRWGVLVNEHVRSASDPTA
jgi:predicted transcriptional regulator of viral defense system